MDLCNPVMTIKCIDGEGGSREGGDGGLGLNDDIEGGGHDIVVVVVV